VRQDKTVRRRLVYVLAWAVATALTAGVSWLGLSTVLSAAAPQRTVPRSVANETLVTPTKATGRPLVNPSWTQTSNGHGGLVYRRTITTKGGDVAVWCEPDTVRILETVPKPGYAVNVTRISETVVEVSFTKDRLASRVLVRWWDGPYAEVSESVT
jgi:hypothetical protein